MDQYASRKYVVSMIIMIVGSIFLIRLFFIQVINPTYKLSAETNTRRMEILYPARGLIYDRNKVLIAQNQPTYDLKISPSELHPFDSLLLCQILNIDIQTLREGIKKVREKPEERRNAFIKQLPPEIYARLKEKQYMFPGFYFSARTLRKYEFQIASHLLGYVGEVDSSNIKENAYYEMGDYYGVSGIERTYEQYLRGVKGRKYTLIDVHGREKGPYKEGKYNTTAQPGKSVVLTINSALQEYGERLMHHFKGSIVAIDPRTGEVLALVSAPTYDPDLLVGRDRETNYLKLSRDSLKPLFNNAIQALYPPGSTFKPVNALVALQEHTIVNATTFGCAQGFHAKGITVKCHSHISPLDLVRAIQYSCNGYFCNVFLRILDDSEFPTCEDAYNNWRQHLSTFGFSEPLGIDLPYEKGGFIPKSTYFDKYYGKGRWKPLTIISMAIGQGEVLTTPLQIANLAATIANRGYYYKPHVVKEIEGIDTICSKYLKINRVNIDTSLFTVVVNGMEMAVNTPGGTAGIAKNPDIIICGKTGTAENSQGEDHSVFMAFAPKDNPRIAISVYVEHGKWGATYAAPIASLMIEKYLTDSIAPARKWLEKRMLETLIKVK